MNTLIKIILAVLFLLCLADMPYGYFQMVRFAALIGFALLAYDAHQRSQPQQMILFIGLAMLFQPIFKIALGRALWNVVDVVVALGLLASLFFKTKTYNR